MTVPGVARLKRTRRLSVVTPWTFEDSAKWLSRSDAVTGGPPPRGGVPVAGAVLGYWPGVAMRLAVKVQVSVGSSKPLLLTSPATNVGLKSSAVLPGVPLSSRTVTPDRGTLPGLVTR